MNAPKKTKGVVNKSAEIRRVASLLVAKGQHPRPKDIVTELRKKGIVVLSSQVSTALRDTDFALRQLRVDWGSPRVLFPEPALAISQVSYEELAAAKEFVSNMGGQEKAIASIVALQCLKQTPPDQAEDYYAGA